MFSAISILGRSRNDKDNQTMLHMSDSNSWSKHRKMKSILERLLCIICWCRVPTPIRERYTFVYVYELCDINKYVSTSFTNSYTFIENRNRHLNLMIGIDIFHSAFGLLPQRVFCREFLIFTIAVSTNHQIIKVRSQYKIKSLTELMNAEFLWKNFRFLYYFGSFMMNNSFHVYD